jgi:hypothetical protein
MFLSFRSMIPSPPRLFSLPDTLELLTATSLARKKGFLSFEHSGLETMTWQKSVLQGVKGKVFLQKTVLQLSAF